MKSPLLLSKVFGVGLLLLSLLAPNSLAQAAATNAALVEFVNNLTAAAEPVAAPPAPPTSPTPPAPGENQFPPGHALVSIAVPLAFFVTVFSILGLFVITGFRKQRMLHETVRLMIEKGQPIPPEFLRAEKKPRDSTTDLRRGLIFGSVGLGLMFFMIVQNNDAWGLGMVPLLIGVAYLVVWKVEGRKRDQG